MSEFSRHYTKEELPMLTKHGLLQSVRGSFLVAAIGCVMLSPLRVNAATTRNLTVDASTGAILITEASTGDPANIINITRGTKEQVTWTVKPLSTQGHTHLMVLFNPNHFFGGGATSTQLATRQALDTGSISITETAGTNDDCKYSLVVWDDASTANPIPIYYLDPTIRVGSGSGNGNSIIFESQQPGLQSILQHLTEIEDKLVDALPKPKPK
jgi:hypothetical protein